jgi:hypothetical protein
MSTSWLKKIGSVLGGNIIKDVADVVDRFHMSGEDKAKLNIEMERVVNSRVAEHEETARAEINARARVIEAEMEHGTAYAKNARPSVVYAGLLFTLLQMTELVGKVPEEFWWAWGGICSTWVVGRTVERVSGTKNAAVSAVTGSAKSSISEKLL